MGVYINMEMPKSCHACCFFGQADIWESDFDGYTKSFCKRTGSQTYDYVDKFLPNCPLFPVPPHGRLIDADQFHKDNKDYWDRDFNYPQYEDTLADLVNAAPTVIPASEEGEVL